MLNGRSKGDSPAGYTYISANGISIIDLAWCSLSGIHLIKDFEVAEIATRSDHLAILVILDYKTYKNYRYITRKIDLKNRKNISVCRETSKLCRSSGTINNMSNILMTTICNVASSLGLLRKQERNRTAANILKPWFDSECVTAKKNVRFTLKQCKKDGFLESSVLNHTLAKINYKDITVNKRKMYENAEIELLMKASNSSEFWTQINKFRFTSKLNLNPINLDIWYHYLLSSS